MRSSLQLVLAGVLTLCCVDAMAQGSCADVLGSVFDKTDTAHYYVASRSMENFFCSRTFASESAAREAGIQVGIPIDGLPLQLGGHARSNDWSAYQTELCHIITTNETVDEQTFVKLQEINEHVINAWRECVTANRPGLYFYSEVNDDARTVSFITRFLGVENQQDTIRLRTPSLVLTPASVLQCADSFPANIGRNPETVACHRANDADGALTAVLRTRTVGSPQVSVPIVHPKDGPRPLCTQVTLLSRGARAEASSNGHEAAAAIDGQTTPGNWNALAEAPQEIRIFLPRMSTVTHISMNPEQTPAGRTVNILSVFRRKADGTDEEVVVGTVDQNTISGGVVTFVVPGQQRDVTAVKVRSAVWPGFVSWREIEIFGCAQ